MNVKNAKMSIMRLIVLIAKTENLKVQLNPKVHLNPQVREKVEVKVEEKVLEEKVATVKNRKVEVAQEEKEVGPQMVQV